jgi:hypothetical protein
LTPTSVGDVSVVEASVGVVEPRRLHGQVAGVPVTNVEV